MAVVKEKHRILIIEHLYFYYRDNLALKDISMEVSKNKVTALIGPSGCGKTTLLRCINRMHDLISGQQI